MSSPSSPVRRIQAKRGGAAARCLSPTSPAPSKVRLERLLEAHQPTQRPSCARQASLIALGFLLGLLVASAVPSWTKGLLAPGTRALRPGGKQDADADNVLWGRRAGAGMAGPPPSMLPPPAMKASTGQLLSAGGVPLKPSLGSYNLLQANPGLAMQQPALVAEFEAAPWLLPPRTEALPYAGVHDFDSLLALRSQPAGKHSKSVALLLFSKGWAVMAQNSIYSMVKLGGVRNYIAIAWTEGDLEACADLNLPCADVRGMLVERPKSRGGLSRHDFQLAVWLKPAVVLRALQSGHVVMMADTDIGYTVKPLWDSFLEFIDQGSADGAWQREFPVNSGQFVLLPTPGSIKFAAAWLASAPDMLRQKISEQKALPLLEGKRFVTCDQLCRCYRSKFQLIEEGRRQEVAIFRTYPPGYLMYTASGCAIGSEIWAPRPNPCDFSIVYLHPVCTLGTAAKEVVLRTTGFWFMDSQQGVCPPQNGSASQTPACRPLQWRLPETEVPHYSCGSFGLGLVHGVEPAAVTALRAGASGEQAEQLLQAAKDTVCSGAAA